MKRAWISIGLFICVLSIGLVWFLLGLFHGVFDHGSFSIQQTQPSPLGKIAIIASRSDHEALSGSQYFVIISDHLPSPAEIKYAYYHDGVVFRSGSDCLIVHWKNEHELIIRCTDHSVAADEIAVEQNRSGDVAIEYEEIPAMLSR